MRLIPRSLFGRLVLVLLLGLLLAQLLSAWILLRDRGDVAHEILRAGVTERTAALVQLLDPMPEQQRAQAVAALALAIPPLYISLESEPLSVDRELASSNPLETLLRARLRQSLPSHFQLRVSAWEPREWDPSDKQSFQPTDRGMHKHAVPPFGGDRWGPVPSHRRRGPAPAFLIQVRLSDGHWLIIHRPVPQTLLTLPYRLLAILVVLLLAVVLIALVAVRWLTRPLRTLALAADQLGRDIDRPPLDEQGSTEVAGAARAFNTMQSRLKRYLDDRTRILSAVSHDLKTPITRMRLRTEMMEDSNLKKKFETDLDDMESMVSATLDFMRSDGAREQSQTVDMMALLESLVENVHDSGWEVELQGQVHRPFAGKPMALKRCLNNLLENAVRYGKSATIDILDTDHELCIRILDQGEGIPEAELERVFEPFYRREHSRSRHTGGTGLGLGIARNIARSHGGDLTLTNRETGGLEAKLILPRSGA